MQFQSSILGAPQPDHFAAANSSSRIAPAGPKQVCFNRQFRWSKFDLPVNNPDFESNNLAKSLNHNIVETYLIKTKSTEHHPTAAL